MVLPPWSGSSNIGLCGVTSWSGSSNVVLGSVNFLVNISLCCLVLIPYLVFSLCYEILIP